MIEAGGEGGRGGGGWGARLRLTVGCCSLALQSTNEEEASEEGEGGELRLALKSRQEFSEMMTVKRGSCKCQRL